MGAANGRTTAEIVALGDARAQRDSSRGSDAVALDTAGAMLRAAREDAGYTTDEVSDEINVKADRLDAIEAMDLGALPSAPYSLGFVRAYADFLGLPVEPLVARFREEAGWSRPVTAPKIAAPRPVSRDREVGLAGVLVVLAFIVWAVWQIVGRSPEPEATLPTGFPIADRTETPQVVPEVTTSLEDDLTLTPPVVVEDTGVPAASGSTEAGAAGVAEAPRSAQAADTPVTERRALPPLVPLVLASPLGETSPARPTASAPAEPAPRAPSAADALNERLLEEVLADSEPAQAPPPVRQAPAPSADSRPAAAPEPEPSVRAQAAPVATRVAAELTDPVSPVYPRRCERAASEEEVVTVRFSVSRFGRVTNPDIAASTNDCFNDAALSAVSRFGFDPATEGGRAVAETSRTSRIVFRRP